jgi:hypothetical protein
MTMFRSFPMNFVERDDKEPRPPRPPKFKSWRMSQQSALFWTIPRDKDGKLVLGMPKPALRLRQKDAGDGN